MSEEDKTMLFDGFEKAFLGILRRCGQSIPIAIYDYGRCMDILMERDGMEEDEAVEWIEHNSIGAWVGDGTPAMLFRCGLSELAEECDLPLSESNERDYGDEDPNIDNDDDMTEEEQELVDEAIQNFALNFMRYVKEVDTSLYNRAKQYASDYSGNSVVEFVDLDEGDPKKETEE
jgi:hypothetical protein